MYDSDPNCIFCGILAGREPGTFVYRDPACAAFMDTQPVTPGHVLVVPLAHAATLAELPILPPAPASAAAVPGSQGRSTGADLFRVGQRLAAALRRSGLRCEGVNFWLADGEAAGQDVFHVHLHVFPRFQGDGFGLILPETYSNRPPREALE